MRRAGKDFRFHGNMLNCKATEKAAARKEGVRWMRLFIAVKLSDEIRKALAKIQEDLRRQGVQGRYLTPENLHMTLAFIGEVPDPDPVLEAADAVPFPAFPITLKEAGIFKSNILWAGIRPSEPLEKLVKHLRRELAEADIPFDRQTFRPHITLIRGLDTEKGLPEIRLPEVTMTVDHMTVYRSDRGRDGMIYTEI